MLNEELKTKLTELLPSLTFDEGDPMGKSWVTANIEPGELLPLAGKLLHDEALLFDYLFCVTCIDWKTHLSMVYHLTSTQYRHTIVIKAKLDRNEPAIDTLSYLWRTAEFHEREAYEMFGVKFINHPDLRLLILPDGWEGKNPMRKDFEDPVNMIKL